jgi:hypothetical protein
VRYFRHAVALDERRSKFKANHWNRPTAKEERLGISGQKPVHGKPKHIKKHSLRNMERQYSDEQDRPTDIEEVRTFFFFFSFSGSFFFFLGN